MTMQDGVLAMNIEQAHKVITCLAEILPGKLDTGGSCGFNGVWYSDTDDNGVEWYFDSTWGGDDGFHEGKMMTFVTITTITAPGRATIVSCHDRCDPDAPYVWDNPLQVARWIVDQIEKGIP